MYTALRSAIFVTLASVVLFCGTQIVSALPGDLDTTFNGTGKVTVDIATGNDGGRAVAIQPDGKIIVAGDCITAGNSDICLVRFNPNGSLDTSFDIDGKVTTPIGTMGDFATAISILDDGKILVVGRYQFSVSVILGVLIRYNTNGSLDTTFGGGDGWSQVLMQEATSMVVQPDGKIIVAGGQTSGVADGQSRQHRFNADGTTDTTFGNGIAGQGTNAIAYDTFTGTDHDTRAIALQPDGKIIVGGCRASGSCIYGLARLNANGSLDTTFDTDGRVTTAGLGAIEELRIQPDGKILAIGALNEDFNVTRYNPDGSLDVSFGTNGRVSTPFVGIDGVRSGIVQADGKIVVGGTSGGIDTNFAIARYTTAGVLDGTFSGDGKVTIDLGSTADSSYGMAMDSSGRFVMAGVSANFFAVARVLGDVTATGPTPYDFDGDRKADYSIWRPSNSLGVPDFHVRRSSDGGLAGVEWGIQTDQPTVADFDGDGRSDYAVWRQSSGNDSGFYILQSNASVFRFEVFGLAGDRSNAVGDWDGDGKADVAVYRDGPQGYFYYRGSLNNPAGNITYVPWGTTGDENVRGDFDGDGKRDAAIYRSSNSTWYIRRSMNGDLQTANWGLASDTRVEGDFDGDSKTDLCVFRSSDTTWYILQSSNNQPLYRKFGVAGDQLVPADYDGDGSTDVAVFRSGVWYVLGSSAGTSSIANFGLAGDVAVPAAYVR